MSEQIDEDAPSTNKPAKRARRTKEEIQQEKRQKEINKISREINTAKNSKCEQYLYCYCSNFLLSINDQIEAQLRSIFSERKLDAQLTFEEMEYSKVYWKKKRIMAVLEEEQVKRVESMEMQFGFMIVLDGETFKTLVRKEQLDGYAADILKKHTSADESRSHMTLAILGAHSVPDTKITLLSVQLFEAHRVQLRFCREALDVCFLIAQTHRALAKMEKKLETGVDALHVNIEKGIREGEHLVEDWWGRMLMQLYRVPEECRRAILDRFPSPFALMRALETLSAGDAMQSLADIQCTNNRRVGPAIAQKLYLLMTSDDGSEILDRPNLNG